MRSIVLASTSPYRQQLLERLKIPFVTASPLYEEKLDQGVAPELLVKHQAYHKAKSLAGDYPDALILGADQVFVDPRNFILGKPGTLDRAVEQLRSMTGKVHTFYTGIAVYDSRTEDSVTDYATYTVMLRSLSEEQIRSYVRRENPVDCAGSFKIEGLGIALMEQMKGDDYTSLIGLPLIKLTRILNQFGVDVL
jgi:septum formation protein